MLPMFAMHFLLIRKKIAFPSHSPTLYQLTEVQCSMSYWRLLGYASVFWFGVEPLLSGHHWFSLCAPNAAHRMRPEWKTAGAWDTIPEVHLGTGREKAFFSLLDFQQEFLLRKLSSSLDLLKPSSVQIGSFSLGPIQKAGMVTISNSTFLHIWTERMTNQTWCLHTHLLMFWESFHINKIIPSHGWMWLKVLLRATENKICAGKENHLNSPQWLSLGWVPVSLNQKIMDQSSMLAQAHEQ